MVGGDGFVDVVLGVGCGEEVCFELGGGQVDVLVEHGMEVAGKFFGVAGDGVFEVADGSVGEEEAGH